MCYHTSERDITSINNVKSVQDLYYILAVVIFRKKSDILVVYFYKCFA